MKFGFKMFAVLLLACAVAKGVSASEIAVQDGWEIWSQWTTGDNMILVASRIHNYIRGDPSAIEVHYKLMNNTNKTITFKAVAHCGWDSAGHPIDLNMGIITLGPGQVLVDPGNFTNHRTRTVTITIISISQ